MKNIKPMSSPVLPGNSENAGAFDSEVKCPALLCKLLSAVFSQNRIFAGSIRGSFIFSPISLPGRDGSPAAVCLERVAIKLCDVQMVIGRQRLRIGLKTCPQFIYVLVAEIDNKRSHPGVSK